MTAWLLLSVGEDLSRAGNDGYDDQADSYYSWDSTVPNHAALAPQDTIVLWDKKTSLGMSVIEEVFDPIVEQKKRQKCPNCHKAEIKIRKLSPPEHRYRCFACKTVFAEPEVHETQVRKYRERHDACWTPLEGVFEGHELRSMAVSPRSQLSIRQLDWGLFREALGHKGLADSAVQVSGRAEFGATAGHVRVLARARLGQGRFRRGLLERHGSACAVTGPQPTEVLEAAHLYSYAAVGEHHEHGGLLLRRDIHALFDRGHLAVHPDTLEVSLAAHVLTYSTYEGLEGRRLNTPLTQAQRKWLKVHWDQHRRLA